MTTAELLLAGGRRLAKRAMPYFSARIDGFVVRAWDMPATGATATGFFLFNRAEIEGRVAEQGGIVVRAFETCAWSWLHEALHLELRHFSRCGSRDPHLWNIAADLAIAVMLDRLPGVRRPPNRVHPREMDLPENLGAEQYYDLLRSRADAMREQGEECGSCAHGRPQPGEPGPGDPGAPTPARLRQIEREVARAIREAESKRAGTVPAELAMWTSVEPDPPHVDWRRELRRIRLDGRPPHRGGDAHALMRFDAPNRRQAALGFGAGRPVLPRPRGVRPEVAVAVDTSGSMNGLGRAVLGEVDGILRALEARATVIACDAEVQTVRRVSSIAEAAAGLVGGGGTSFHPIVEAVAALRPTPTLLIIVTDSFGPAPAEPPPCEVVWCLIGGAERAPADWGRVVVVPDPV